MTVHLPHPVWYFFPIEIKRIICLPVGMKHLRLCFFRTYYIEHATGRGKRRDTGRTASTKDWRATVMEWTQVKWLQSLSHPQKTLVQVRRRLQIEIGGGFN